MQSATMFCLELMFCVLMVELVYGRPPLPPLPMKGGCYRVFPELDMFRVEGEAVILAFPSFESVLKVRKITPPKADYLISKANGTEATTFQGYSRIQQNNKQLWFLPAQASDSGEYFCTYRNETYCVAGSIKLHVYKSSSVDIKKVSYPRLASVGEDLTVECPSLDNLNKTGTLIKWYKQGRKGSYHQDHGNLKIPAVKTHDAGIYTCQLSVLINNQQYKVSRDILLYVEDPQVTIATDRTLTSGPGLLSSTSGYSTVFSLESQPPVIISPINGTIFETPHGSGLELTCKVLTECETADSTVVTWLVNNKSLDLSNLYGRVLQMDRRVTRMSDGCVIDLGLAVEALTEQDIKTELKCVTHNQGGRREVVIQLQLEDSTYTWLVVAAVAFSFFLTVVSVFLYVLFKPKRNKKKDYILARQHSTF